MFHCYAVIDHVSTSLSRQFFSFLNTHDYIISSLIIFEIPEILEQEFHKISEPSANKKKKTIDFYAC